MSLGDVEQAASLAGAGQRDGIDAAVRHLLDRGDDIGIGGFRVVDVGQHRIDRGALRDTVIGEGSKIDNLVMIAHNCQIGRGCVIAGQVGLAGSVVLEDGVVLAGQVGLGDHSRVGAGARMGARSGTGSSIFLPGGVDYGGAPAKPVREWAREIHALAAAYGWTEAEILSLGEARRSFYLQMVQQ